MWFAGGLDALSSVTYSSVNAFVSVYAKENQHDKTQTSHVFILEL